MYSISFAGGGNYSLAQAQRDVSELCTPGVLDSAHYLLAGLERLGCRGTAYANEDFDLISRAHSMVSRSRADFPPEFREEECGGAFDGFTVTSDADCGL